MPRSLSVVLLAAFIFPPVIDWGLTARAAEPTVKDVRVGEILYGPAVADDQLKDTAVFVEYWGIH